MLGNGVILPSTSPWASRVILIRKKDGSTLLAVDNITLNDLTEKDSYTLPVMKDIMD